MAKGDRHYAWNPDNQTGVVDEMLRGSDFACAILGASMLDLAIRDILDKHFKRPEKELKTAIFDRAGAPLSSLGHKINIALALGLISKPFSENLHRLRRIRNEFAHRAQRLTFDTPDVAVQCAKLSGDWNASVSPRNRYSQATFIAVVEFAKIAKSQLQKERRALDRTYERNVAALEKRHQRSMSELNRLLELTTRQIGGQPLTKSERATYRRLSAKHAADEEESKGI